MNLRLISAVVVSLGSCFPTIGSAQGERAEKQVTLDQAVACMKAAVAARPGRIGELEVDIKDGRTICEVKLVAANGKKSEIEIDAVTEKVIKVKD